jgi:deazaflavin-dependent oxidoreductase (nitroreductase family)
MDVVHDELRDDPTIDITTTGRRSGQPRRVEIWMLDVDGRFFITGTPGRRDWLANLTEHPDLVVHLKRHAHVDLPARAEVVSDPVTRRRVLDHLSALVPGTGAVDDLMARSPMVEVTFPADAQG